MNGIALVVLYVLVCFAVALLVFWHPTERRAEDPGEFDDYQVALMGVGGNEKRAMALAMLQLRDVGIIDAGELALHERARARGLGHVALYWRIHDRGRPLGRPPGTRLVGPLPTDAHPLERAVYEAANRASDPARVGGLPVGGKE